MVNSTVETSSLRRNAYYDYVRALAIFFVIAIHLFNRIPINPSNNGLSEVAVSVWRIIISCAVPLFLAISGFFMAKKDVGTKTKYYAFLRKQIPRVYIPCFIWSLPYFYWEIKDTGIAIKALINLLFCGYSVFYFVLLITVFYLLLPLMQKAGKSLLGVIISIVISVLSIILRTLFKSDILGETPSLIFSALFFPMWMSFFVVGIYYGSGHHLRISNILTIGVMLFFIVMAVLETKYLSSKFGFYGESQNKMTNSLFSLCCIVLFFNNAFLQCVPRSAVAKFTAYVGKISFGIYLVHMLVLMYLDLIGDKLFGGFRLPWFILPIVILILSIIFITICKRINNRIAVKYLGF